MPLLLSFFIYFRCYQSCLCSSLLACEPVKAITTFPIDLPLKPTIIRTRFARLRLSLYVHRYSRCCNNGHRCNINIHTYNILEQSTSFTGYDNFFSFQGFSVYICPNLVHLEASVKYLITLLNMLHD